MRLFTAGLLFVHGVAHLPGFLVAWRVAAFPELPYRTVVFGGAYDVGDSGTRVLGLVWLALALAFVAAALLVAITGRIPQRILAVLLPASLTMCASASPEARLGVLPNFLLCGLLLRRAGG